MNAKIDSETHEVFWDTNDAGELVLRFRGEVWMSFDADYPQPTGDGAKGIIEYGSNSGSKRLGTNKRKRK